MRFKSTIKNISTFTKLTSSLSSLGKTAWMKLEPEEIRFTIIPDQGTQVWAVIHIDTLFEDYRIASAAQNVINLQLSLDTLHRALRSAYSASDASIRLTKRASDGAPVLCLTITTMTSSSRLSAPVLASGNTTVTQEVPVKVLSASNVADLVEPTCPEPDVHIILPPLSQLRAISERFNRLTQASGSLSVSDSHRLLLSANMQGEFKMQIETDVVKVESLFRGLVNPELDPMQIEGGIENHPSTRRDRAEFAEVRVEGKEWVRLLKVYSIAKRVIACFCVGHALVLYVYLTDIDEDHSAVLTYYMSSYSA
ncbi:Hus1-like protein [Terfezia boudieri ATCC MYA-4762]|uniref:Checkpoint protein n=1 Tax=Terfezia boudieri ATCC MYA-4762 TaxID=1051890 RepID=A0A3N4LDJ3_9PEZI|nr:Hus1-like protein [Terfezia boudieri ATCC MYA-4762]